MEERAAPRRFLGVWIALVVLTGATFGLYHLDLGRFALATALAIATVKSALVVLFFMELWEHRGANRLVFAVTLVYLALLAALAIADVATRFPLAVPGPS
jgi:cytochrome c oxidase subunit 4